jgi:hypothetical protein
MPPVNNVESVPFMVDKVGSDVALTAEALLWMLW